MTSDITGLARQSRVRAEEARTRAEETDDVTVRTSLLQIAETWGRMAKWEGKTTPERHL